MVNVVRVDDDAGRLTFRLADTSKEFVNLLRSALISRVAVPAIAEVTFKLNTSTVNDDMLAHRIGLLQINCDAAADAKVAFRIDPVVKTTIVRARDVSCKGCTFSLPDEVIVVLNKHEALDFGASVEFGTGAQHSRCIPVIASAFTPVPVFMVNERLRTAQTAECLRELTTLSYKRVYDDAHHINDPAITVETNDSEFDLAFESTGCIHPAELFDRALRACEHACDVTKQSLLSKHSVSVQTGDCQALPMELD